MMSPEPLHTDAGREFVSGPGIGQQNARKAFSSNQRRPEGDLHSKFQNFIIINRFRIILHIVPFYFHLELDFLILIPEPKLMYIVSILGKLCCIYIVVFLNAES